MRHLVAGSSSRLRVREYFLPPPTTHQLARSFLNRLRLSIFSTSQIKSLDAPSAADTLGELDSQLTRFPPRYARRAGIDRVLPALLFLPFLLPPYLRSASPSAIASLPSHPLWFSYRRSRDQSLRTRSRCSKIYQIQVARFPRLRLKRPPNEQPTAATDSFGNDRRPTKLSFIQQLVFSSQRFSHGFAASLGVPKSCA